MDKFKITIEERSKCVVEIEADSLEAARQLVEDEYWKHPDNYLLEPYDTFFE